ncbi:MAG: DNRLRE domain-containing protein, partial [Tissierellia bacterium]|nr:DNRLRE domain-containing protein [Tissierellia bacterium]
MEILNGLLNLVTNENKVVTQHYKLFDEVIQGESSGDTRISLSGHPLPLIVGYYSNDFYININQIKTASGVPSWYGNTSFRDYVIQYTLSKDFNILTDSINDFRWVTIASHSGDTRNLITHDVNIQDAEAVRWIITKQNHGTYLDLVEFALYGELIPKPPKSIDYIIYSTKKKSVGDTILINWGASFRATRYELQYYINNEWITINNNITNTEYVYTFEQPNPSAQFRVRGINEDGSSDWVEGEVFEVTYQSSIKSNIVVNPLNKMRGYIDIIGVGDSDLDSNITIRQFHKKDLDSLLEISKKYEIDSLDSNITVAIRDSSFLDGKIALNPSGRMRGFVDIVQPPKKTLRIYPVKDSVVRQSAPTINYGDSQQMLAGESEEGRFISYLGFDVKLPDNADIVSIKLVLNKQYDTSLRFFMGLYETSDDWNEYDITWSFRPLDEKYITQFPIPTEEGKVEVDITDFNWEDGKKSFILRPRNYAFSELTAFGTKESLSPPYIEVTYYEIVNNAGSYSFDSSITVRKNVIRGINARIDVQSDYVYTEFEGLLEIEKKFIREEIESTILVAELRHSEVGGQIELTKKHREIEIDTTIIVPYKTFIDSTIGLERKDRENDLESSLIIRAYGKEDLEGILEIEGKTADNDLESSLVTRAYEKENLKGTLEIESKIENNYLDSVIVVSRGSDEDLESSLEIENKY